MDTCADSHAAQSSVPQDEQATSRDEKAACHDEWPSGQDAVTDGRAETVPRRLHPRVFQSRPVRKRIDNHYGVPRIPAFWFTLNLPFNYLQEIHRFKQATQDCKDAFCSGTPSASIRRNAREEGVAAVGNQGSEARVWSPRAGGRSPEPWTAPSGVSNCSGSSPCRRARATTIGKSGDDAQSNCSRSEGGPSAQAQS